MRMKSFEKFELLVMVRWWASTFAESYKLQLILLLDAMRSFSIKMPLFLDKRANKRSFCYCVFRILVTSSRVTLPAAHENGVKSRAHSLVLSLRVTIKLFEIAAQTAPSTECIIEMDFQIGTNFRYSNLICSLYFLLAIEEHHLTTYSVHSPTHTNTLLEIGKVSATAENQLVAPNRWQTRFNV